MNTGVITGILQYKNKNVNKQCHNVLLLCYDVYMYYMYYYLHEMSQAMFTINK